LQNLYFFIVSFLQKDFLLTYDSQNEIVIFAPLRESHGTGREWHYLACSWTLMNSILYAVGHFLMQITYLKNFL